MSAKSFRQNAYKENPKLAIQTDWITQNESQLKVLHKKYIKDTGDTISFIAFADFIYNNAQDLIISYN